MTLILSDRTAGFGSCVTRLSSILCREAGGINLAQGFPEEDPPDCVLKAHTSALMEGHNQYADMRGLHELREAVCRHRAEMHPGSVYDAGSEALIGCGATEMAAAACLATINIGDEVLLQSPAYENYRPQVLLAGGAPRYYCLSANNQIDMDSLRRAISPRTRAIIFNSPNNPTGRVFSGMELSEVARLCCERDLIAIIDEVYEHLVWEKRSMLSLASLPGMRERSIVISSLSKGWRATGWRVGWALAPEQLMAGVRRCHDFLTGCAPTAAQIAAVTALSMAPEFYLKQAAEYEERRKILGRALEEAGFGFTWPEGTYYFFVDARPLGYGDSRSFAEDLLREASVGVVPWHAFFDDASPETTSWFRIYFAKSTQTVSEAVERIRAFALKLRNKTKAR